LTFVGLSLKYGLPLAAYSVAGPAQTKHVSNAGSKHPLRLSPLDPLGYLVTAGLAAAHVVARQYEEAIEWADRSLRELPRYESALRNRVVACAHLGRIEEARDWLERLLELRPGLTIAGYNALYAGTHPQDILEVYSEGLRKAGLPEE
jgi:tetratricopeptide (TPR) repeat protein